MIKAGNFSLLRSKRYLTENFDNTRSTTFPPET